MNTVSVRAHRRGIGWLVMAALLCTGVTRAETTETSPAKTIRVLCVGASSFGPEIMINANNIAMASANVRFEPEGGAGYFWMAYFVTQPGFYEEFCARVLPMIEAKRFDYVVMQTITGWTVMTPEEQDKMLTVFLPDLVAKIRKLGAEVALYDKFVDGDYKNEKDLRARKWHGRYPDAQRLTNLLHILAAKKSGISKVAFSGGAIVDGWEIEPFKSMKYLYNDGGHPGVIGQYINGLCVAAMLTGVDPVGCPVRKLPMSGEGRAGWVPKAFQNEPARGGQAFYDKWKNRIDGNTFTMSDEEAKLAQDVALKHRRYWDGRLQAALKDPAEFAKVEAEIAEIRAGFDKPELVGMSAKSIEAWKAKTQLGVSSEGISELAIKKARDKSKGMVDFSKLVAKRLKAPDDKAVLEACRNFWTEYNSKLRDDVLFEAMVHAERVEVQGNREEVARMKLVVGVVNRILNMGGCRMIYEKLPEPEKAAFLAEQKGPVKRYAPKLVEALTASAADPDRYFKVCENYLKVWEDVNLMDKLKESKFAIEVFLEADQLFAQSSP